MKITKVKIRKLYSKESEKIKAIVSIVLDNCFTVHDIRVIQLESKTIVAMPSRKNKNCGFIDIVHPINSTFREVIETEIIKTYKNAVGDLNE